MSNTNPLMWRRGLAGWRRVCQYMVALASVLVVACTDGSPTAPTPPSNTLRQLRLEGSELEVGKSIRIRAVGEYSDNSTRDLTSQVAWSSSNMDVATVTPDGQVTGRIAGAVTIRAAFENREGSLLLVVLARSWQVSLIVQRIECLGDCEDFTQGNGDFSYRVELSTDGGNASIVAGSSNYPSANGVVRLAAGGSVNINVTREFSIRDADGRSVDLRFRATEWDDFLGSSVADSRMADESSTARYQYGANQDWLPNGPNFITIGQTGCRLRLHYTILKQ